MQCAERHTQVAKRGDIPLIDTLLLVALVVWAAMLLWDATRMFLTVLSRRREWADKLIAQDKEQAKKDKPSIKPQTYEWGNFEVKECVCDHCQAGGVIDDCVCSYCHGDGYLYPPTTRPTMVRNA